MEFVWVALLHIGANPHATDGEIFKLKIASTSRSKEMEPHGQIGRDQLMGVGTFFTLEKETYLTSRHITEITTRTAKHTEQPASNHQHHGWFILQPYWNWFASSTPKETGNEKSREPNAGGGEETDLNWRTGNAESGRATNQSLLVQKYN
jgi:hypothetical protein